MREQCLRTSTNSRPATTTPVEELEARLLYRCVSETRWRKLTAEEFLPLYVAEVGSPSDTVIAHHILTSATYGSCAICHLENDLAVLEAPLGRFSLYETEARCRARDHINAWADFARGYWTLQVPQEPGLYFVKPAEDGGPQTIRELRRTNSRLRDVTRGFPLPRPGLVSEWRGYWWIPKVPQLP